MFFSGTKRFNKLSNDIISVQTGKYKSWTYHDMDSIHQGKLVVHTITLKTTLQKKSVTNA